MSKVLEQMTEKDFKKAMTERFNRLAGEPYGLFNYPVGRKFAESVGYPLEILNKLPNSVCESFAGAGNPHPFISIHPGDCVLDLGCGGGLDLSRYALAAGVSGKVYGADMADEMIAKAKRNMHVLQFSNVELFLCGVDRVPLPASSVDLVTANGIFNFCFNKDAVIREAARVLRPGGRTIFAEMVLTAALPKAETIDPDEWVSGVAGAMTESEFIERLKKNGLSHPRVLWRGRNPRTGHRLAVSVIVHAEKE